ncbi:MAG TPA: hypothetical protein ENK49_14075 [Gammaproteobacteria bacterium]|nr:hypothetical protein [Gammaproteobacteria bacterium]
MDYAAERHFVSPDAVLQGDDAGNLPWEADIGSSRARHDTWLLSFIDILALLLTLFVLLLAYQDSERKPALPTLAPQQSSAPEFSFNLDTLGRIFRPPLPVSADASGSEGYAMPGPGLLPVDVQEAQREPATAAATVSADPAPEPAEEALPAPEPAEQVPVEQASVQVAPIAGDGPLPNEETHPDDTRQAIPDEVVPPVKPDAAQALLEVFEVSRLRDQVEVTVHPGEVSLEISDRILFDRGSAVLTQEGLALLRDLAEALEDQPYILSVEGHTDNTPIETARYPSNWELSSARAAVVTRKLVEQGIASDKVRAIGYGATRPLADNDSPEGRARNRRVSFVLQVDVKDEGRVEARLEPQDEPRTD